MVNIDIMNVLIIVIFPKGVSDLLLHMFAISCTFHLTKRVHFI